MSEMLFYEIEVTGNKLALQRVFDLLTSYMEDNPEDSFDGEYSEDVPNINDEEDRVKFGFATEDSFVSDGVFDAMRDITMEEPSLCVMILEADDSEYSSILHSIEKGEATAIANWSASLSMDVALLAVDLSKRPTPKLIVKIVTMIIDMILDSEGGDQWDDGFDYVNGLMTADALAESLMDALTPALAENKSVASKLRKLGPRIAELKESIEKLACGNEPFCRIEELAAICEAAELDFVALKKPNEIARGKEKTLRI